MKSISVGVDRITLNFLHRIKQQIRNEQGFSMSFNAIVFDALKKKYPDEFRLYHKDWLNDFKAGKTEKERGVR